MQAPVETPENRASVTTATSLPHGMCFSAEVIWYVSSIPEPIGPRQISTSTSPARIAPAP